MRPSEQLEGMTLANGWKVIALAQKHPKATGGLNSTGYIVENADGRKGFLKAMDYTDALKHPNSAQVIELLAKAYNFEKTICEQCQQHRLRRVLHAIDSGSVQADPSPSGKVEYLIFDLAQGDVRAHICTQQDFDIAFLLRTLHNAATGLQQMHKAEMAHQDLKPSNVLVFGQKEGSKLSDLGRSWSRSTSSPFDHMDVPGDNGYAPPERLYKQPHDASAKHRVASDLYHLGSLGVFLFTGVHMNAMVIPKLHPDHRPFRWTGTFEDVLPHIKQAFAEAMRDIRNAMPDGVPTELLDEIVAQLCEPDPTQRGHPLDRRLDQFSLKRYISRLNLLAERAESRLREGR